VLVLLARMQDFDVYVTYLVACHAGVCRMKNLGNLSGLWKIFVFHLKIVFTCRLYAFCVDVGGNLCWALGLRRWAFVSVVTDPIRLLVSR